MTREQIVKFGKRHYGEEWISQLARDIGYDRSTLLRVVTGEIPTVSRRMELEMKRLIRIKQLEVLARPEMRY